MIPMAANCGYKISLPILFKKIISLPIYVSFHKYYTLIVRINKKRRNDWIDGLKIGGLGG